MIPILVPSLLPGIALVYLFGTQGLIKELMFGYSIYGPIGIVIAEVFFTLPHAIIILITSLSIADARLYEAAVALRASRLRIFLTVTLPGCRYGLISAAFVVFTLSITDFGAPKVIGGDFNVLATDVYKQVIGQQNFEMGAVVSVVLLIPAVLAFAVDRVVQRRQVALLSSRAVALEPKPSRGFDLAMLGFCVLVSVFLLGMLGTCQYAALVKFYPYDPELRAPELRLRRDGRRRLGCVLELDPDGDLDRDLRNRRGLRRRVPGGEGPRIPGRPHPVPVPGDDADGGPRTGPGACLHLLLQPPRQPPRVPLPHDGDPGESAPSSTSTPWPT